MVGGKPFSTRHTGYLYKRDTKRTRQEREIEMFQYKREKIWQASTNQETIIGQVKISKT